MPCLPPIRKGGGLITIDARDLESLVHVSPAAFAWLINGEDFPDDASSGAPKNGFKMKELAHAHASKGPQLKFGSNSIAPRHPARQCFLLALILGCLDV